VKPRLIAAATASDAAAKLFLTVNMLVSFAVIRVRRFIQLSQAQ
jgi:hypothetical protein